MKLYSGDAPPPAGWPSGLPWYQGGLPSIPGVPGLPTGFPGAPAAGGAPAGWPSWLPWPGATATPAGVPGLPSSGPPPGWPAGWPWPGAGAAQGVPGVPAGLPANWGVPPSVYTPDPRYPVPTPTDVFGTLWGASTGQGAEQPGAIPTAQKVGGFGGAAVAQGLAILFPGWH